MAKKPRIVIIGAGMSGLTAANKLYTSTISKNLFELFVVEGGNRIGGRINTSEFGGDRIEMGATWIHGIGGSPVYQIAQKIRALESDKPWECMDSSSDEPKTIAEGGFELNADIVHPISTLFKNLMDFAQGKLADQDTADLAAKAAAAAASKGKQSVGAFLRQGLDAYWDSLKDREEELTGYGKWSRKLLEEAIFAMYENTQRTYTSAGDLSTLDFEAESEYRMFPGEEITIAKGYFTVIEHLASVLPPGVIQLGRKVTKIEWQPQVHHQSIETPNGYDSKPVKIHFGDGSVILADHVIVTVSLGVLKAGTCEDSSSGMFIPPLPSYKTEAISRLGYGVVNKLFMQLSNQKAKFPSLQMVFHSPGSDLRQKKIPWWIRRTASLSPIYSNSSVLLSWYAGKEALELETLSDDEIINGVSKTVSSLLLSQPHNDSHNICNGNGKYVESSESESEVGFSKVLKTKWASDPLFLGSYSYVAVGSSGADLDTMAEPLPEVVESSVGGGSSGGVRPLQILFAGEATHRTHYSTTHGAYFSGLREANRLLQHYNCVEV